MGEKIISWMVVAVVLIVIGCVLFGVVMQKFQWDFTNLSTTRYETNAHYITDVYSNIQITTAAAKVVLAPSEDGTTSVVCYEQTNVKHTVSVQAGTLSVTVTDTRQWYDYIGIHFGSPTITIHLPADTYGNLTVKGSTGDVHIPQDFSFAAVDVAVSTGDVTCRASAAGDVTIRTSTGDIETTGVSATAMNLSVSTGNITATSIVCTADMTFSVSTGKVALTDVRCQNLMTGGNTGDVSLKNVVAAETFSIVRTTGDVWFEACDATEITVTVDTGDVRGSLLTDKVFIAHTDTGRIDLPQTLTGGRCEITTDTGDIAITIQ